MKALLGIALTMGISSAAIAAKPATFDIEFKGGTLSEWVDAVQAAAPQSNIILQPNDSSVAVPPLSLHNVTVGTCAELVDAIPGATAMEIGAGGGDVVWVVDAYQYVQAANARSRRASGGMASVTPALGETEVFQIPPSYRAPDNAVLLQGVMWEVCLMGGMEEPFITVFSDVGLIAVHGSQRQIKVCDAVIQTVSTKRKGSQQAQSLPNERAALLKRINDLSKFRRNAEPGPELDATNQEWKEAFEELRRLPGKDADESSQSS